MGSPSMNLYDAIVTGAILKLGSQQLTIRPRADLDGRVIVGVRPEHLAVGNGDVGRTLVADVELVEALGNEQLVHFSLDAPLFTEVAAQVAEDRGTPTTATGIARVAPGRPVTAGSRTSFHVDVDHLHFFEPGTGAALGGV